MHGMGKKKLTGGKHVTPRRAVQLPEDWFLLAQALAARGLFRPHIGARFGFEQLGLNELVALTVPGNLRSRAVMERLGMLRDPADDFDHPQIPEGSRLRRHVLYRRSR